jgi:hypothetical protein
MCVFLYTTERKYLYSKYKQTLELPLYSAVTPAAQISIAKWNVTGHIILVSLKKNPVAIGKNWFAHINTPMTIFKTLH